MKKTILVIILSLIFGLTALAEATLYNRGGGLIYCDELDITLLQDANYGAGSIYDDGDDTTDGKMTWNNARDWAEALEYYDPIRDVTWDDWRLPSAYNQDGSGPDSDSNVIGSEMGHIYYTELGNIEGGPLKNSGDFDNLQPYYYWSGTECAGNTDFAWCFHFNNGTQTYGLHHKEQFYYCALAVRDGDVETTEIKIMPLGDSLTHGMGSTYETGYTGYRWELYNLLIKRGVNFDFVGSQKTGPVWEEGCGHNGTGAYRFNSDGGLDAGEYFPTKPDTGSDYTITAWIYMPTLYREIREYKGGYGGINSIICGGHEKFEGNHYLWAPSELNNSNNKWINCLTAGHGLDQYAIQDNENLEKDTWYFVAITFDYDKGKLVLYKDGNEVGSEILEEEYRKVTDKRISIGSFGTDHRGFFRGLIDEVRIYDVVLTQIEIKEIYNDDNSNIKTEDMILYLPMNNKNNPLEDMSDNKIEVTTTNNKKDPNFDWDHEGHPGWYAKDDDDTTKYDIYNNIDQWLEEASPDVVLLHIGSNDIAIPQDPFSIACEIKDILDKIKSYKINFGKQVTVFLASIIKNKGLALHQTIPELNSIIDSYASNNDKIIIVDMENVVDPNDFNQALSARHSGLDKDPVHPNDNGYKKMAESWYKALIKAIPIIKANGSDGPLTISATSPLTITIELDPLFSLGQNADWWLLAYEANSNLHYYYNLDKAKWLNYNLDEANGLNNTHVTYQGPLVNLPLGSVPNADEVPNRMGGEYTKLPKGLYTFAFGVDTHMDGSLNMDTNTLSYDIVEVNIVSVAADIKANGSDGPLTIPETSPLSITIELDPGELLGEDAEWWLLAHEANNDNHWYCDANDANNIVWLPDTDVYFNPNTNLYVNTDCTYQGPLFNLSQVEVLTMTGEDTQCGFYTFSFGVDMVKNGSLDMDTLYYDSVEVHICGQGACSNVDGNQVYTGTGLGDTSGLEDGGEGLFATAFNNSVTLCDVLPAAPTPPSILTTLNNNGSSSPGEDIVISINIPLQSGWSMISLPVIPADAKVGTLFPEAEVIYCYERGIGYERVNNLEVGKGYWILFNKYRCYGLKGQIIPSYSNIIYSDGWSMIGGCTKPAKVITDSCSISVIYKYEPGSGYKRVLASENIDPGWGYWILLNGIEEDSEGKLIVEAIE